MKKIIVKRFHVRTESNRIGESLEKNLTKEINNECPDGYHYKETIHCSYKVYGLNCDLCSMDAFIVFEED